MVLVVEEQNTKEIDDRRFEYVSFEEEDQLSAQGQLTGLLQPRSS